jgi:hypothetical protein
LRSDHERSRAESPFLGLLSSPSTLLLLSSLSVRTRFPFACILQRYSQCIALYDEGHVYEDSSAPHRVEALILLAQYGTSPSTHVITISFDIASFDRMLDSASFQSTRVNSTHVHTSAPFPVLPLPMRDSFGTLFSLISGKVRDMPRFQFIALHESRSHAIAFCCAICSTTKLRHYFVCLASAINIQVHMTCLDSVLASLLSVFPSFDLLSYSLQQQITISTIRLFHKWGATSCERRTVTSVLASTNLFHFVYY